MVPSRSELTDHVRNRFTVYFTVDQLTTTQLCKSTRPTNSVRVQNLSLSYIQVLTFFSPVALRPNAGHGLLILDVSRSHTTTHHSPPLDEWSARRRDLYLTTHDTHNRQTSMPPVGFEPTISAGERPQTAHLRPRCHWDRRFFFLYE